METTTENELIERVRTRDDRGAFGELVRRNQSAVRGFLRHLTHGDNALADDLAQETFIRAYQQLGRFRGEARLSTWLLGIAHNQYRNARRRLLSRREQPEAEAGDATEPAGTRAADLRADLGQALRELSADERLAVHLGYTQGLSHSEIATLVDWPIGTVKSHLARSKEKLRHHLAAWNPQT